MQTLVDEEVISRQLVRIAAELRDLGLVARTSAIDPTILADFRSAVDHARLTAWALQYCLREHDDGLDVNPTLARERIHRIIELCEALEKDIARPQTEADIAAKELLYAAAKRLRDHLEHGPH